MVGTEGARPTYRNFLEVAVSAGIQADEVSAAVEAVVHAVDRWARYAKKFGVARTTIARIGEALGRARADGLTDRPLVVGAGRRGQQR
jgi:hypothetical protein